MNIDLYLWLQICAYSVEPEWWFGWCNDWCKRIHGGCGIGWESKTYENGYVEITHEE